MNSRTCFSASCYFHFSLVPTSPSQWELLPYILACMPPHAEHCTSSRLQYLLLFLPYHSCHSVVHDSGLIQYLRYFIALSISTLYFNLILSEISQILTVFWWYWPYVYLWYADTKIAYLWLSCQHYKYTLFSKAHSPMLHFQSSRFQCLELSNIVSLTAIINISCHKLAVATLFHNTYHSVYCFIVSSYYDLFCITVHWYYDFL